MSSCIVVVGRQPSGWMETLATAGFQIVSSLNAEEARRSLAPIALVVDARDAAVPAASACEELRRDPCHRTVPLVVILPAAEGDACVEALGAGADVVLIAPDEALVAAQVRALLRRREIDAEEQRRHESRLAVALDAAGEAPWEIDLETGLLEASPRLCEIVGIAPELNLHTREQWRGFVVPEDRALVADVIARLIKKGGVAEAAFRIRRASDGALRWLRCHGTAGGDQSGWVRRLIGVAADITERRQAEETQARLASIVESSDAAISSEDLSGTILTWNTGAERLLGYAAEEILGRPVSVLVPPERRGEEFEILRRLGCGETVVHLETVRLTKDGRRLDVSVIVSALKDRDGQLIGASKISRDITERNRAVAGLQRSEERLRLALHTTSGAVWDWDLVSGDAWWSAEMYELWGVEPGTAMQLDNSLSRVIEADRARLEASVEEAIAARADFRCEFRITHPVRGECWMNSFGRPVFDAQDRAVRLVGVTVDITDRKRAEEDLRHSRRLLAEAEKLSHTGAWEWDLVTDRWSFSDEWLAIHGCGSRPLTPKQLLQIACPEDRDAITAAMEGVRAGRSPYDIEHRIVRQRDGAVRIVLARGRFVQDGNGRVTRVFGFAQDVTERRQAEAALREANERLAEADRRKDEFIAVLSHELRNPLAAIRYALPLLQREPLSAHPARGVAVINRQVDHLVRLVDDLLDVSRITRGKIELRREHLTIGGVLSAAMEAASPAIVAARHTVEMHLPEEPLWLWADPERLAQVITNLLNNSAKYTPRGGHIALSATREDREAVVRVRDTGVGIPAAQLGTVFEMFRQVERHDTAQGGLGIGLALARRLVELHGGSIEASSAGVGHGAEFLVRLPLAEPSAATSVVQGDASTEGLVSNRRLKVLVVDDNADLVEMLSMVVESAGHEVRKALDGRSAIAAARAYRPHVVLLDLGLPVVPGVEVARELRRHAETNQARIVALTGWGQAEDRRQTEAAGFDYHLTKPADPLLLAELLAGLASDLGTRRPELQGNAAEKDHGSR